MGCLFSTMCDLWSLARHRAGCRCCGCSWNCGHLCMSGYSLMVLWIAALIIAIMESVPFALTLAHWPNDDTGNDLGSGHNDALNNGCWPPLHLWTLINSSVGLVWALMTIIVPYVAPERYGSHPKWLCDNYYRTTPLIVFLSLIASTALGLYWIIQSSMGACYNSTWQQQGLWAAAVMQVTYHVIILILDFIAASYVYKYRRRPNYSMDIFDIEPPSQMYEDRGTARAGGPIYKPKRGTARATATRQRQENGGANRSVTIEMESKNQSRRPHHNFNKKNNNELEREHKHPSPPPQIMDDEPSSLPRVVSPTHPAVLSQGDVNNGSMEGMLDEMSVWTRVRHWWYGDTPSVTPPIGSVPVPPPTGNPPGGAQLSLTPLSSIASSSSTFVSSQQPKPDVVVPSADSGSSSSSTATPAQVSRYAAPIIHMPLGARIFTSAPQPT
jgi:hypothetical protein